MIYTLTLNPAVDYIIHTEKLTPGNILRGRSEQLFFGGKGINVSVILQEHGVASTATGFLAGFTGKAIEKSLAQKNISCDFVHLTDGFSRINVKIRSSEETDINGTGPAISEKDLASLFRKLDRLQDGDTLILAGSVPPSLPENIYEKMMEANSSKKIRFIVDTTGENLLRTLRFRPFLIKPNTEELSEIFSVPLKTAESVLPYAIKLREMGARNVLVSMGGQGALLLDESGKEHHIKALPGEVVNTVGAGDSMVAGFLAGYEQTSDYAFALKLGAASGTATAFCEGLAEITHIREIFARM